MMPNELDPLVDQWYSHVDKGQRFYITAINERAGTVEIQHFDSNLEEFTLEEWKELDIELAEAPENWSGAMDIGTRDDFGTGVTDTSGEDWTDPQREFPRSDR